MGIKCGIVGLPNVGKSTLFNALTSGAAATANYPFCTIDPNNGYAELNDFRLQKIAAIAQSKKIIPSAVEFVDIAGLIAGASQNAGLGNRFLAHIRQTDGIAHVVRCFDSPGITHVSDKINPADDISTINTELTLADLETVEKSLLKNNKLAKSGDSAAQKLCAVAQKLVAHLGQGNPARTIELTDSESSIADNFFLLTKKPLVYIANLDENNLTDNPHIKTVTQIAASENAPMVPICAQVEADLCNLTEKEKEEMLKDYGYRQTGLARLARATFDMLGLATYFTAGPQEARSWTIRKGMTAPQAAGVIHTDFMRGFIRAEVCTWEEYLEHGGEAPTRTAGKLRAEGKDYLVQDGDIIHFRFNT